RLPWSGRRAPPCAQPQYVTVACRLEYDGTHLLLCHVCLSSEGKRVASKPRIVLSAVYLVTEHRQHSSLTSRYANQRPSPGGRRGSAWPGVTFRHVFCCVCSAFSRR